MKYAKIIWIILLIAVWGIGIHLIFNYYYTEPDNKSIRVLNSGYYPIRYDLQLECKDVDTSYWAERDEIQCEISFESKNKTFSIIPKLLLKVNGNEKLPSLNSFAPNNANINNAITIDSTKNKLSFKVYPTESGVYDIEFNTRIFEPQLTYQEINSNNISIDFEIKPMVENLSSTEWYLDYFSKGIKEINKTVNYKSVYLEYECINFMTTWFTNDYINCNLYVKGNDKKATHILTEFKILKGGEEVSLDPETVSYNNNFDDGYKIPSVFSRIEVGSDIKKAFWFKVLKPGNYTTLVAERLINTNLDKISSTEDKINLRFNILSREEYIRKEENRKVFFISLLIALLFSAPVALNSIKELVN